MIFLFLEFYSTGGIFNISKVCKYLSKRFSHCLFSLVWTSLSEDFALVCALPLLLFLLSWVWGKKSGSCCWVKIFVDHMPKWSLINVVFFVVCCCYLLRRSRVLKMEELKKVHELNFSWFKFWTHKAWHASMAKCIKSQQIIVAIHQSVWSKLHRYMSLLEIFFAPKVWSKKSAKQKIYNFNPKV